MSHVVLLEESWQYRLRLRGWSADAGAAGAGAAAAAVASASVEVAGFCRRRTLVVDDAVGAVSRRTHARVRVGFPQPAGDAVTPETLVMTESRVTLIR